MLKNKINLEIVFIFQIYKKITQSVVLIDYFFEEYKNSRFVLR